MPKELTMRDLAEFTAAICTRSDSGRYTVPFTPEQKNAVVHIFTGIVADPALADISPEDTSEIIIDAAQLKEITGKIKKASGVLWERLTDTQKSDLTTLAASLSETHLGG